MIYTRDCDHSNSTIRGWVVNWINWRGTVTTTMQHSELKESPFEVSTIISAFFYCSYEIVVLAYFPVSLGRIEELDGAAGELRYTLLIAFFIREDGYVALSC